MQQILGVGADAAQYAEDGLDEDRWLHEAAIEEVRQVIEVPYVVALELEAGTVRAHRLQQALDVGEGITEDMSARHLEISRLPVKLELLDTAGHRVETEIHRSHVERAHLRLHSLRSGQSLVDRHRLRAAGGDVDDGVGALLDAGQETEEDLRVRSRLTSLRIARVQMQDRRPFAGRADSVLGDLIWCDRQIRRLRRDVDRPGDCAGNDDLTGRRGHSSLLLLESPGITVSR